jgi:hypothetical protein
MAKELPYFKFEPNEWENGNIQMLGHEEKGVFIDLCSMYWSRLGDLPYKLALQKICGGNATALQSLCDENIIAVEGEYIRIYFLDEQLNEFKKLRKKNSDNAKKRWRKAADNQEVNATALRPHCDRNAIREEKRREEEIREDNTSKKNSTKKRECEFNNEYNAPSLKVADMLDITPKEVEEIQNDFEIWFKAYDNNAGKMQAQREWSMLTDKERKKCLQVVDEYTTKTPKRFRKKPVNYLIEKIFNDEIINRNTKKQSKNEQFNEKAKRNWETFGTEWDF